MSDAVGFDLDMTLVDSSPGIVATLRASLGEIGIEVAAEQAWPLIGIPLEATVQTLAPHLTEAEALGRADRYRELYPETGVPLSTVLPGVVDTFDAVRAAGMRVAVVSAKNPRAVRLVLEHVGLMAEGLRPDEIRGGLFAAGKGTAIREFGASIYVGDHPGDIEAARAGGAVAVAVASGPHSAEALAAGEPDVVLGSLEAFPPWLAAHLAGSAERYGQESQGRKG